jgi:hypothetical protein
MRRVFAALLAAPGFGVALAEDLTFTGSIPVDCTVVAAGGSLAPNGARDTLSSKETGGTAGAAEVTVAAGSFNVTIGGPSGFDYAPSGGEDNVSFQTEYNAWGASSASGYAESSPIFAANSGVTFISIDETASKDDGASFPAGDYGLTATVNCSP